MRRCQNRVFVFGQQRFDSCGLELLLCIATPGDDDHVLCGVLDSRQNRGRNRLPTATHVTQRLAWLHRQNVVQ